MSELTQLETDEKEEVNKRSSCYSNKRASRRRDGLWAWFVLAHFAVSSFFLGGFSFGFGAILPQLMVSFDSSREQIALVGSLRLGLTFFLSAASSKVCERFTCRKANFLGYLLLTVAFLLGSYSMSIYFLYASYSFISGVGGSLAYTSGFISVRQYFNKRYSLAIGIVCAGTGLGMLILGTFLHEMVETLDWRMVFRVMAAPHSVLMLFSFVLDPNVEKQGDNQVNTAKNCLKKEKEVQSRLLLGFIDLSVWSFPEYVVSVVSIFISSFGSYTALIHMVKFSEEISIRNGSRLFIYFGSATVISRLLSGRLCDVKSIRPRYVHQAGAMLSGVSTILLGFAQTYTHLVIFAIFYGIADGAFRVTLQILFMNTVDVPRQPSAFGQATMVNSITLAAGPAIAGLMADMSGSYVRAFCMAGSVTILGASILFVNLCLRQKEVSSRETLALV